MHTVRQPAVAGSFYPGDPAALLRSVDGHLAAARAGLAPDAVAPKAVIVPHAGYVYSGSTAALAFARVGLARDTIERVVLLGPTHRVPVRGLALSGATRWRTPLGEVGTEEHAPGLNALHHVVTSPDVHRWEHSLEVQVPFLQRVLGEFTLVPLAVGDATPDEVADALEEVWGGPETVVVVSSDLSHYHPYSEAQRLDRDTVDRILGLDGPLPDGRACGARPVNGLLLAAARHALAPRLLGLCNSGDTAGDRQRVVGYAAVAFEAVVGAAVPPEEE